MEHTRSLPFWILAVVGCLLLSPCLPHPAAALNKNIAITFAGSGTGTVVIDDTTDDGFDGNCTASCSHAVGNNDVGTLTANADGGSVFVSWSGQSAGITGCASNTCNFAMDNTAQSVTVTFNLLATTTPTSSPTRTPTLTPTLTATRTPTLSPTLTPTSTPTITPTLTPTGIPSDTPTQTATRTPTRTPTITPSQTPTLMGTGPEICDNQIDDNENLLIDCADPLCFGNPVCFTAAPTTSAPMTALLALLLVGLGWLSLRLTQRRAGGEHR